jgi:diguanylate cyclase (GGDEF)-like protein
VARTGGEEFVIVLPETDHAGAGIVAEKIRAAMAAKKVQLGAHSFATTVSIGYASVESQKDLNTFSFEELLRTADARMYEAKSAGRNLVRGSLAMRDPQAPMPAPRPITASIGRSMKLSLVDS